MTPTLTALLLFLALQLGIGTGVERLTAVLLIPSSVLWAAAQVRAFGQVIASASTVNVELAILLAAVFTVGYTSLVTC